MKRSWPSDITNAKFGKSAPERTSERLSEEGGRTFGREASNEDGDMDQKDASDIWGGIMDSHK